MVVRGEEGRLSWGLGTDVYDHSSQCTASVLNCNIRERCIGRVFGLIEVLPDFVGNLLLDWMGLLFSLGCGQLINCSCCCLLGGWGMVADS